jgi:hypothetical protein
VLDASETLEIREPFQYLLETLALRVTLNYHVTKGLKVKAIQPSVYKTVVSAGADPMLTIRIVSMVSLVDVVITLEEDGLTMSSLKVSKKET